MKPPESLDIIGWVKHLIQRIDRERVKHRAGVIIDPNSVQSTANEFPIWKAVPADITITRIEITLDIGTKEVAGDAVYADAFIGKANPVVINPFDTISGVLDDSSITVGAVPAGKTVYFSFDSAPDATIKTMYFDISYTYD
jgi:hypothetical protein